MSLPYVKPRLICKGFIDPYSLFYMKFCIALADILEDYLIDLRSRDAS